ncbi:MAG: HAD-IA family hydrolase [Clostridiales bacterium]|nr:HAD-IA family hydrolase [Clostridiales bacterium]
MKYKAVLFDLDGTLLYTLPDIAKGINLALAANDIPEVSEEQVKSFIGNGARKLVERAIAVSGEGDTDKVLSDFRRLYFDCCTDSTLPYDGIKELLDQLRQNSIKLGVVSNKPDNAAQKVISYYFPGCFDHVRGSGSFETRKPDPFMVYECLSALDVNSSEAVYIGDSDVDIKTAENSGLDSISVSWGFKGREFLEKNNASLIVDKVDELREVLI